MASHDIFKKLTEELSSLLEKEGLAVRPYSSPQLYFFGLMPEKQQLETISGLKHYIEAARRVLRLGHSLKDSEVFVKTGLEYYGFETHPDFSLRAFEPNVVVEFYSLNATQLFRTFNYFEVTSYTLEDIYCRQWVHLYERPEEIVQKMFREIEEMVLSKDPLKTLMYGPHILRERVSLERLGVYCDGVHVSPLTRNGNVVALASLVAVRPLERTDG